MRRSITGGVQPVFLVWPLVGRRYQTVPSLRCIRQSGRGGVDWVSARLVADISLSRGLICSSAHLQAACRWDCHDVVFRTPHSFRAHPITRYFILFAEPLITDPSIWAALLSLREIPAQDRCALVASTMADSVQYALDRMVVDLEDLRYREIFSEVREKKINLRWVWVVDRGSKRHSDAAFTAKRCNSRGPGGDGPRSGVYRQEPTSRKRSVVGCLQPATGAVSGVVLKLRTNPPPFFQTDGYSFAGL